MQIKQISNFINKHKTKSLLAIIGTTILVIYNHFGTAASIFSWLGTTPENVKKFFQHDLVTLNLWQLFLVVIFNISFLLISLLIMRHVLDKKMENKLILKKEKEDEKNLFEAKQRIRNLIDDWEKLSERQNEIQINVGVKQNPFEFRSKIFDDGQREYIYSIKTDDSFFLNFSKLKDQTDAEIENLALTYPKIKNFEKKIKELYICSSHSVRGYIEESTKVTLNRIIDTLKNIYTFL